MAEEVTIPTETIVPAEPGTRLAVIILRTQEERHGVRLGSIPVPFRLDARLCQLGTEFGSP